jgi:hypothetical protein
MVVAFFTLGAVLAYLMFVASSPRSGMVAIVDAQGGQTASTKTVLIARARNDDPFAFQGVLEGTTPAQGAEPSQDELKWLVRDDMPQRPAWPWLVAFGFQAGDDWLKNLSVDFANRTVKKIDRIVVQVAFPELKQSSGLEGGIAAMLYFGRLPSSVAYDVNGAPLQFAGGQSLELRSGYEMPLSLARDEPRLRSVIGRYQAFSTVSLCRVTFRSVTFDDGMRWTEGGGYSTPDPAQPGRYRPVARGYFPAARKPSPPTP